MSGTEKKSDTVRRLVRGRDYRSALRIAKEFRLGISKEERDAMRLAYECMVSPRLLSAVGQGLRRRDRVRRGRPGPVVR